MDNPLHVVSIVYGATAFVVWCASVYYMFRVVTLRKPGTKVFWGDTRYNPFNVLFFSSKLTEAGLRARRRLFILASIFIGMVLMPVLFGAIMK